ncbi:hypothetical protein JOC86_002196 [Bacillus pakistanensis]|uniref:YhfM-like domain-containing protein n=1 Tax=Rossellomorea pakistanensis TaxID=992288 RepID=A0ABS2NCW2_9BACI|nr:hypothetical protein [Bacillus pakistanensis]MBM7585654.1 hypothetical protein [Bacillus pakistanensis]
MNTIKFLLSILIIFTMGACSNANQENVEEIKVNYWLNDEMQSETEFIQEDETISNFVNATNNAEKLDKQKVIKTPPLLTYTLVMQDDDTNEYHLWLTTDGKGYIQSLTNKDSLTYKLNEESVVDLTSEIENTKSELLQKLEFE